MRKLYLAALMAATVVTVSAQGVTIYNEPFSSLPGGSVDEPAPLALDNLDNIPATMLASEANYGFGGALLYSLGDALAIYAEQGATFGELWTPDLNVECTYTMTFEARALDEEDEVRVYTFELPVAAGDEFYELSTEWQSYTFEVSAIGCAGNNGKFQILFEPFVDIAVRNLVITGEGDNLPQEPQEPDEPQEPQEPADGMVTMLDETFATLTQGSIADPVAIVTDELDNIPADMLSPGNYGFGGHCLFQAGGALRINAESRDYYGDLWSPVFPDNNNYTLTFEARYAEEPEYDSEFLVDVAGMPVGVEEFFEAGPEWHTYTLTIAGAGIHAPAGKFQIVIEPFCDIVLRNFKLVGETPSILSPVALPYADFTGTSFTARWEAVEGATAYIFSCAEYDMLAGSIGNLVGGERTVEGTSVLVDGLTPGKCYIYWVKATDGTNTSSESNRIVVADLATPADIRAEATTWEAVDVQWSAVPGANRYGVELRERLTAPAGSGYTSYTILDADLSDYPIPDEAYEYTFGLDAPYEIEAPSITLDDLPGWTISMPSIVPGGVGFWDNDFVTQFFGYQAYMSSGVLDLSQTRNNAVNLEFDAASAFGNSLLVALFTYNAETRSYDLADYDIINSLGNFRTYYMTLQGGNDRSILQFTNGGVEQYMDKASFYASMRLSVELADGASVSYPIATATTDTPAVNIPYALNQEATYAVNITPFLVDDEGAILIQGATTADYAVTLPEPDGIDTAMQPDSRVIAIYNLQGQPVSEMRPGTVYLQRRADGTVTKVVSR